MAQNPWLSFCIGHISLTFFPHTFAGDAQLMLQLETFPLSSSLQPSHIKPLNECEGSQCQL